jgi:hypothetical protein
MPIYVNAAQARLLSRFVALRSSAFGLGSEVGAAFARESAREWKARGFAGLASACFNLREATKGIVGGYDVYSRARDLAAALAAA